MVEAFHRKKKEKLDSSIVLASQEDEIVFAPTSEPPSPIQEEGKSSLTPKLSLMSPMLSDMSPSLKTSTMTGWNGLTRLLPPTAPDLDEESEDEDDTDDDEEAGIIIVEA